MKRYHLFEFNDQPWLPAIFRNFLTDILQYHLTSSKVYQPALPLIREVLQKTGYKTVIDLCSGASGPWLTIADQLRAEDGNPVDIFLTDKYPNLNLGLTVKNIGHKNLRFVKTSVDSRS